MGNNATKSIRNTETTTEDPPKNRSDNNSAEEYRSPNPETCTTTTTITFPTQSEGLELGLSIGLTQDMIYFIFSVIGAKPMLATRSVSKAWHVFVSDPAFWKTLCIKESVFFPEYDTIPSDWAAYWILWNCPSRQFTENFVSVLPEKNYYRHVPSGALVRKKIVLPDTKRRAPCFATGTRLTTGHRDNGKSFEELNFQFVKVIEGNLLSDLLCMEIGSKALYADDTVIATLIVDYLNAKQIQSVYNSIEKIIISKSGRPIFGKTKVLGPRVETRRRMCTGLFVRKALSVDGPLEWTKNFVTKIMDFSGGDSSRFFFPKLWSKDIKAFCKFLFSGTTDSSLSLKAIISHTFLVTHYDPTYKSLAAANAAKGFSTLKLGPKSGIWYLEHNQETKKEEKRDSDFMSFDDAIQLDAMTNPFSGFAYVANYLSPYDTTQLLENIEKGEWVNDHEGKRVQVFGYNYLSPTSERKPIPIFFASLLEKLSATTSCGTFDQLIISDYPPGVGLADHVDRLFWGSTIAGISLVGTCTMNLRYHWGSEGNPKEMQQVLSPSSLYILSGPSRFYCTHGIDAVQERRISLTFRTLATETAKYPLTTSNFFSHA